MPTTSTLYRTHTTVATCHH